jgi:hypothetical protein
VGEILWAEAAVMHGTYLAGIDATAQKSVALENLVNWRTRWKCGYRIREWPTMQMTSSHEPVDLK